MYVKQGSIVPVALQLVDGATGLFPSAVLCDGAGATVSGGPLSLTHAANGLYVNNAFAMPNKATVHVQYRVYSDSARTIPYVGYELAVDTFLLDTTPTATDNAAAVRTNLATELARVDVATSTRLATAGYTVPPTAVANAAQVRTNLTTELARMDVAVSTRLATAGYTAPLNTPTLAQIEASTVLAKEATVASRATQTSVEALGTPAQAAALATLSGTNQTEHDATQAAIAALPVPPNAPDVAAAVLSAAQITPIHSEMRRTNGQDIIGDGTEGNKFRSSLVG